MSTYRLVFQTTTSTELRFADSTVATDGDLTVVLQGGERVFALPTKNVIAIERMPDPAPSPEPT